MGLGDLIVEFQSTLPARGATSFDARTRAAQAISIHAPRTGSDRSPSGQLTAQLFQSTLPARGATGGVSEHHRAPLNFNPRSPHGERPFALQNRALFVQFQSTLPARGATQQPARASQQPVISIHAPRTGSDDFACAGFLRRLGISIHAPRTGSAARAASRRQSRQQFQSTLPARGATALKYVQRQPRIFQSTLPARGATQPPAEHASGQQFQSTLPARGATASDSSSAGIPTISIHAPRTGSDQSRQPEPAAASNFNPRSPHGERQCRSESKVSSNKYFNPRSPHGERPVFASISRQCSRFQSTLPARGATAVPGDVQRAGGISIHAPRTGSDDSAGACPRAAQNFNPRSPHGERPPRGGRTRQRKGISIHAPRTGSDARAASRRLSGQQFQSTLPARGATTRTRTPKCCWTNFNPRSPHGERLLATI